MPDPSVVGRIPVVLLVEDNFIVGLSLAMELEAEGFRVIGPVGRVVPALQLVEQTPVDAAVLDVDVAGELSFPIAEALLAKGIPVAFVTAHPTAEIHKLFPDAVVLPKPVHEDVVAHMVKRLVAKAAS